MLSWVFPCICRAFSPMATSLSLRRSRATMLGSSTTILSLWMMMVLAVPRSIANSCERKENNPMLLFFLMFEMAVSCKYHGNVVLIAKRDGLVVANGTSGLYNGGDACFLGQLHRIGKGEEGVGGHNGSLQVKFEGPGFADGVFKGIYPGCLSHPAGDELFVFGQYDGVGFGMLHYFVGKQQIFDFLCAGCSLGYTFQVVRGFGFGVALLNEYAVEQGTRLQCGLGLLFQN